jgi:PI-3-kinase-related kinase SMG-1
MQDTVDILVGWFVDPAQPVKVIRSATRALQILRPFWKEDLSFSKTLLSQFLEDLDAYAAVSKIGIILIHFHKTIVF